ncbi:MAG: DUF327 family protein [Brevinematales bacterium]|nr:DUF327 family protein [Brevinematales bacterium]
MNVPKIQNRGYSPTKISKSGSYRTNTFFFDNLQQEVGRLVSSDLDEILKKLNKLGEDTEKGFREDNISTYREVLKELITKVLQVVRVIEKSSNRNKDKILKVLVVNDEKLKQMLEDVISSELSKLKVKGIIKELTGIIVSLKV